MYLCVAFLGAMVFVDGLMQGEVLRPFAGGIVAASFGRFMFRGFPLPARWARRAEKDMDTILSLRAGATSPFFRWTMVVLGAAMGFGALLLAVMMLAGPPEAIESIMPKVARSLRGAESGGSGMLARAGLAAVFAIAGGAALLTAWKRLR